MKVFISHSGERSRALAEKVQWFVRILIPSTEPWISTGIDKGLRWEPELAENLEQASVGIICLTTENLDARWLLFEAGALSKRLDGEVCTLLLDVEPAQIKPPLSQFQHTRAECSDIWQLVETINKAVAGANERPRPDGDLRESFDAFWPKLEATIKELRERVPAVPRPARSEPGMLAEVLDLVREIGRQSGMQQKTLAMLHQVYRAVVQEEAPPLAALRQAVWGRRGTIKDLTNLGADPLRSAAAEPLGPVNATSERDDPKK